jgi:HTH-type transcriptional regulator / antitoxin HigA
MGTLTLDLKRYGRLLAQTAPKVIETEKEYTRALERIEALMDKGESRSHEETELYRLLVALVERCEEVHYPMEPVPPVEMLQYLMEQRGLRQVDLVPMFGSSGYVSDIVNGRRGISKAHAKKLAAFFKVGADLFL